jgi:hypothetical protein
MNKNDERKRRQEKRRAKKHQPRSEHNGEPDCFDTDETFWVSVEANGSKAPEGQVLLAEMNCWGADGKLKQFFVDAHGGFWLPDAARAPSLMIGQLLAIDRDPTCPRIVESYRGRKVIMVPVNRLTC